MDVPGPLYDFLTMITIPFLIKVLLIIIIILAVFGKFCPYMSKLPFQIFLVLAILASMWYDFGVAVLLVVVLAFSMGKRYSKGERSIGEKVAEEVLKPQKHEDEQKKEQKKEQQHEPENADGEPVAQQALEKYVVSDLLDKASGDFIFDKEHYNNLLAIQGADKNWETQPDVYA
jgi:ABC-type multidrug transport system fused ATPase/permease subunit